MAAWRQAFFLSLLRTHNNVRQDQLQPRPPPPRLFLCTPCHIHGRPYHNGVVIVFLSFKATLVGVAFIRAMVYAAGFS